MRRTLAPRVECLEDRTVPSTVIGVTAVNQLITFDTATPGTNVNITPVTGLQPAEDLLAIDFRPATGQLYGLGSSSRLYTINTTTAVATQVGTGTFAVPLNGGSFGFDFNPVPDRIRVVSDTGQNMRLNPDTGAVVDSDPANAGVQPDPNLNPPGGVVGVAYTSNFAGATATTLYGIDAAGDRLVLIGGPSGVPSPNLGAVTPVGPLGVDTNGNVGFDIIANTNTAYASLTVNNLAQLYRINLSTGAATLVGNIGGGTNQTVRDIAVLSRATTLFGVVNNTTLIRFNSATPSAVISTAITGLQPGERILGIDFRPANGELYGLGSTSRLYLINPATGVAGAQGGGPFTPALSGTDFGFDFNPVVDRIRVVSNTGQNLRLDPFTGAVVAVDAPLNPPTGVVGAAYTDNFAGATATTLFAINSATNQLVRIGGPDGVPSPNGGVVTPIGPLGVPASPDLGFDIAAADGTAFASFSNPLIVPPFTTPQLFTIDRATGAATFVGTIGNFGSMTGLTAAPPGLFQFASSSFSVNENAGTATITINRVGGSESPAAVDVTVSPGTASGGSDFVGFTRTVQFNSRETTQTISIQVLDDTVVEGDETINLSLSNPTLGASLANPSTAVLKIVDDDQSFGGGVVPAIAVGADAGGSPLVKVYDTDGTLRFNLLAYDPSFAGGVRVATGDVTLGGFADIITGAGPGGGPHVKVFDGSTSRLLLSFFAYDPKFTGGVYVAAGDVNGDGIADIITGAGPGGGPHVKVYDFPTGAVIASFFAYAPTFAGGVTVAAADVTGDGRADIITGAGPGGGPHVKVFDGRTFSEVSSFFAYAPIFAGGVFVAAGDVTGDGRADIITGAGAGGGSHVKVFSGQTFAEVNSFFAFGPGFTGGVRVAAESLTGDTPASIITGPGKGDSTVKFFNVTPFAEFNSFVAFPGFNGGVFVG